MYRRYILALAATSIVMILMGCGNGENTSIAPQKESKENLITNEEVKENLEAETDEKFEDSQNNVAEEESLASEDVDYYSICTSKSKQEVEAFATEVKETILREDWEAVSEMAAYPITIQGIEYVDAESLAQADIALREEYKEALEAESCENLFANWQGVMLGNGEVWIGELLDDNMQSQGLKIIAINAED
ncbi:hypothetical protein [Kineothrix sp. MB12-C1]|uniref:hypothetical protein n=1 Tax=Kineothrix sp. MB12-C1 TaxID=3070215 RepID=UPI0027D2D241|nr:hypothetical protein [Kineothrix sp. MB12-C1]WMC93223.1 hypothetical protein RBB56_02760 [Kineothrix sp. MB12-C1]